MNRLLPSPGLLRDRSWWLATAAVALGALAAAMLSYAIALTELSITPILLVPGVGAVLLARWGRALWPGLAAGDALGQAVMHQRTVSLLVLSVALHVVVSLVGATWIRRAGVRLHDLASTARFIGIAAAISAISGLTAMLMLYMHGHIPGGETMGTMTAWLMLGYMSGFIVGGTLVLAWSEPEVPLATERHRPVAMAATAAVTALAFVGFVVPWGPAVPLALLGALGVAGRAGVRWGSLCMFMIAAFAIWGADLDYAPFGGLANGEEAVNTMLAVTLFAGAALLLSAYRDGGEERARSATAVAVVFAVLMLVAGVASLAANAVAINRETPFVLSGLLALGAAISLGILRFTRTPAQPSTRRGLVIAAVAGAIYVVNLALYLQAVPAIGSGTATALSMAAPLAVVLLSIVVYRTRPTWGVVVAVAVIVTGVVIAASGSMDNPFGVALALASAVVFAISLLFTKSALRHASVVDVALVSAAAAAAVALVVGVIVEGPEAFALTREQVGELMLGALGAQLVPILGRSWALGQIDANVVGAEGVLAPVTTAVLSFWLIDAVTTASEVTGLVVIAVGALIATLAGSPRRARATPARPPAAATSPATPGG